MNEARRRSGGRAGWVDLEYEVGPDGRIRSVSSDWDAVAREAGGGRTLASAVVGTILWDHVTDRSSRHLWQLIMERIGASGVERSVPIRCDTPDLRRWIEVRVAPTEDGGFSLRTALQRQERHQALPLLGTPGAGSAGEPIRMCSWCKQVEVPGTGWLEIEEAVDRLDLLTRPTSPPITHGICRSCEGRVLAQAG